VVVRTLSYPAGLQWSCKEAQGLGAKKLSHVSRYFDWTST